MGDQQPHASARGATGHGRETEGLVDRVTDDESERGGALAQRHEGGDDVQRHGHRDEQEEQAAKLGDEYERRGRQGQADGRVHRGDGPHRVEHGRGLVGLERSAERQGQHHEGQRVHRSEQLARPRCREQVHGGGVVGLGSAGAEAALGEHQGHAQRAGDPHPHQRPGAGRAHRQHAAGHSAHAGRRGQRQPEGPAPIGAHVTPAQGGEGPREAAQRHEDRGQQDDEPSPQKQPRDPGVPR